MYNNYRKRTGTSSNDANVYKIGYTAGDLQLPHQDDSGRSLNTVSTAERKPNIYKHSTSPRA